MPGSMVLFLFVVVAFVAAVVIGLSPFLAIPIAVLLLVLPAAWGTFTARLTKRDSTVGEVPSTEDASYNPVVDPAERS